MGQNSKNPQNLTPLRTALIVAVIAFSAEAHAVDGVSNAAINDLMNTGLAHRDAGDFAAAENTFRQIVEAVPTHGDARLLLALVIGYQKRFDEAMDVLEPAITADPLRDDLIIARARLRAWSGDLSQARTDIDTVLARRPNDPTALELAAWLDRSVKNTETTSGDSFIISFNRERSDFERRSVDAWHETRLSIAYLHDDGWTVNGALQDSRRYGNTDTSVELGGGYTLNDSAAVSLKGELSPGADFLPRWGLSGGVDLKVWDGMARVGLGPGIATLNARHRKYTDVNVENVDPGWIQYFGDGSTWLTLRRTHAWSEDGDGVQTGWSARGDMTLDDWVPLSVYALRSKAPETDLGQTVVTWAWAGGVVWHATDMFDLRLDHTQEDRSGSYIRNIWSLGVAVKF